MRVLYYLLSLLLLPVAGFAQANFYTELYPNLFWVDSAVDNIPNYLLLNPVLQVNVKTPLPVAPYLRVGKAFVSGDDVVTANYSEIGVGARVHIDAFFPKRDDRLPGRMHLFIFSDYSLTDYGLDDDLFPIPAEFGKGSLLRIGAGTTLRIWRRFSVGLDIFYKNRKVVIANTGTVGALRLGYHFTPIPSPDKYRKASNSKASQEIDKSTSTNTTGNRLNITYRYGGYAEPIAFDLVHKQRNHIIDLSYWIHNSFAISLSTNIIRSNFASRQTDLRTAGAYFMTFRKNIIPRSKHQYYFELGGGFGDYCTCGDELPRQIDNLRYLRYGMGLNVFVTRNVAAGLHFQSNNILDRIEDKYAYNVFALNVSLALF